MKNWQIIIPMSGFGERFRRSGYNLPKPLIEINGRPLISYVLDLFPGEKDVHFVCNEDHLNNPNYHMKEILVQYCPTGHIHSIKPHKNGPVYAVSKIFDFIDDSRPCAVNYCDFTGILNWSKFKEFAKETKAKGIVICYKGFHPHMLDCVKFAYCKTNTNSDKVLAIQEKSPYTDKPMEEWASCGTYCYDSGRTLKYAFENTLSSEDLRFNGEYYVSLSYRPLLERGDDIRVFPIDYFCQWGTPEDLHTFLYQYRVSKNSLTVQPRRKIPGTTLIPMAGLGSRFAKEGYATVKPLIKIGDEEMVLKAWDDLPKTDRSVFVLRKDMQDYQSVVATICNHCENSEIVYLNRISEGQACTCMAAFDKLISNQPVTVGACDNGYRYNVDKLISLVNENDVVVWSKRGVTGAIKNPKQYGWINEKNGNVVSVSVKKELSNPMNDPIITGAFTFKNPDIMKDCINRMIERKGLINGEYYVDECINDAVSLGYKVGMFEVDDYICWGTPNDLKVWQYWVEFITKRQR